MVNYNSGLNGVTVTNTPTVGQVLEALTTTTASWQSGGGGPPTGAAGGDLGGTYPNPTVTTTHLSAALPLAQGGTGAAAQNFTGLMTPTAVKTTAYNAAAGDFVPVDTTSGAVTVTLPTAPADLTVIGLKMVTQGGTNAVTYACGGSDVLNKAAGATSGSLALLSQGVILQYKASTAIWYVYADDLPLGQLDLRYLKLAGGTMTGAIAMGASKITGLGNGSAASDAAAFGQTLAGGSAGPLTTAGDLLIENASPVPARLPVGSAGQLLGVSGGLPAWITQNLGVFGDGTDGAVTFDGSTTILGLVPAANVYTMTRDIMCSAITVNNGVTVKPNGWRIFCTGTVTNNGTIAANGGSATGTNNSTGGASPLTTAFAMLLGNAGATGGTGAGAQGGGNGTMFGTGTGSAGGSGSGGAGGGNHASNTSITSMFRNPGVAMAAGTGWNNSFKPLGGAGGAGAGGGDGVNNGGGGGGGGGVVVIFAPVVNNGSGSVTANGGNGGSPGTGNCGGGGAGGGGLVLVYTAAAWTAGTTSVNAGSAGTGVGTGNAGAAGTAGTVLNVVLT